MKERNYHDQLNIENTERLRDLIKNRLTEEQKNFFSAELQDKKADVRKIRRNKSLKIALVLGVIALYGGTVFLMKVNEKKQVTATQQSAETEITILNKIIDNDSENIEEDMQKLNYPKKKDLQQCESFLVISFNYFQVICGVPVPVFVSVPFSNSCLTTLPLTIRSLIGPPNWTLFGQQPFVS